jgi:hypothetical protein
MTTVAPPAPAIVLRPADSRGRPDGDNRLETAPEGFNWGLFPEAEDFVDDWLDQLREADPLARELSDRMTAETGTRLFDWVDHLVLFDGDAIRARVQAVGYRPDPLAPAASDESAFFHPHGMFPRIVLIRGRSRHPAFPTAVEVALRPERLADVLCALDLRVPIEGPPLTRYRRAVLSAGPEMILSAVERRGYRGYLFDYPDAAHYRRVEEVAELWRTRPRARSAVAGDAAEDAAFEAASEIADRAFAMVGRDLAGHLFFEAERQYWQDRNSTARFQRHRQDRLGLGWGNHDHHTYRSSRRHFARLIAFEEKLGFKLRERYWAGAEAGWGAQIVEHPVLEITCFNDVDLSPDETTIDFAHEQLPDRDRLGTVGLWCGLHGESFLGAGMHHLECRFDFDGLKSALEAAGRKQMKPFSDFPFLRQAFTEGERWPVAPRRADGLRERGLITAEQAAKFLSEGAIGSHLENLQRKQGFKGFNQKSVSVIIAATDPRLQNGH